MPTALGAAIALLTTPAAAIADASEWRARFATYNVEDVRESSFEQDTDRLKQLATVIQRIDADVLLLNEIAAPPVGTEAGGSLAERFASEHIAMQQQDGLEPINYEVFVAPSNTGMHAGHDLDRNGRITDEPGSRDYAGDCLGYGEFPGQYGMALLVKEQHEVVTEDVRTFREFLWKDMPGALLPTTPGGEPWYSEQELAVLPLSSKSHWDIPIRLGSGAVVHALCSHPTPPVFDGDEDRNGRRNHDEIRFWGDYISGASYIVDDDGTRGGLAADASFVVLGDLNADPEKGDSRGDPVGEFLLAGERIGRREAPTSRTEIEGIRPTVTSSFGLRVDYALPSTDLAVLDSGVWRSPLDDPGTDPPSDGTPDEDGEERSAEGPSDHFPVWVEIGQEPSGEDD